MRRFATFWALAGSCLMLCMLAGAGDWSGESEKALRNQRSRSTRSTRLDADHDTHDQTADLLSGSTASNLSWQADPLRLPLIATTVAHSTFLPELALWEPVHSPQPLPYVSFLRSSSPGRSPPPSIVR